jgi:hypothetical protein
MHQRRTIICECMKTSEIYGGMILQCCDECMSHRKVYEWVEIFNE